MFGKNKLNFIYVSANVRSSAMCLCVFFIHKSCLNSGFNNISFTHLSPGLKNIQIPCLFQDFQAHECSVYVTITSTLFKKSFWLLWLLGSAVFFVTHPWGVTSSHHPRTDLQLCIIPAMCCHPCWRLPADSPLCQQVLPSGLCDVTQVHELLYCSSALKVTAGKFWETTAKFCWSWKNT